MSELLVISWAVVAGVDRRVVAILGVAMLLPFLAMAAIGIHALLNRPRTSTRSAVFCESVARELRSGASLRVAIGEAAGSVGARDVLKALDSGALLIDVVADLRHEFPEIGHEIEVLVAAVADAGSAAAPLFQELGDLALSQVEMTEEIRTATAPARASALVLVGLPVVYLGHQLSTGAIADVLGNPAQQSVAVAGVLLAGIGLVASLLLVRKAV
jgi:Flp pilus assembly protein TadB